MKLRNGFVSNSSCSSFVIQKKELKKRKQELIRDYLNRASGEYADCVGSWDIFETSTEFRFSTIMDNFDLGEFFEENGIKIEYTEY